MARQFNLINSRGEEWNFMRKDAVLINPSELGFSYSEATVRSGAFYVKTSEFPQAKTVTAEIAFKGYEPYKEFASFIRYIPLVLAYMPLDEWYYRDVSIVNLDKGEIDNNGERLYSEIEFASYAPWYRSIKTEAVVRNVETESPKQYPYTYDYQYAGSASGEADISIMNDGTPLRIKIYGYAENPAYSIYNAGVKVGGGKFDITLGANEVLIVDSNPATMEAGIYNATTGAFIRSAYGNGDLSTERFIYLPLGENRIAISCDGGDIGLRAIIEVKDYADAV